MTQCIVVKSPSPISFAQSPIVRVASRLILAPVFHIHRNSSHIPIGYLFFCNIGSKINSMVDPTHTPFTEYLRNPNEHSFFLSKVNVEDVLYEINRLKPRKAAGYDKD